MSQFPVMPPEDTRRMQRCPCARLIYCPFLNCDPFWLRFQGRAKPPRNTPVHGVWHPSRVGVEEGGPGVTKVTRGRHCRLAVTGN